MGAIWSMFSKPPPRRRLPGGYGIFNAIKNNWRGLVSTILGIIFIGAFIEKRANSKSTLAGLWLTMFVFMLLQPMPMSASALLPIFSLPMLGILPSDVCCNCLINENIMLLFLCGWLRLLLNNCGLDKRIICSVLSAKNKDAYTPIQLLLRACSAAFVVSVVADRQLASKAIMEYVVSALAPLQIMKNECDYAALKDIICVGVAVSSVLGSLCFVHTSLSTIQLRALFYETFLQVRGRVEYSDVLNFSDYSSFAIPTAFVMYIVNVGYKALLVSRIAAKKPMSIVSKEKLHTTFAKNKSDLGRMTNHEIISIVFLVLYMAGFFTRWSALLGMGWASFSVLQTTPPNQVHGVKDATVAAIAVVVLHFLPKSVNFMKIWTVKRVGDLPKMKPESGILYWKFVDKHTDYSLFLVTGASLILYQAHKSTGLDSTTFSCCGKLAAFPWPVTLLVPIIHSVLLGNLMPAMAAQACYLPLIFTLTDNRPSLYNKRHILALGVGLGSSLGFCGPHIHTPSYYVSSIGKVPLKKQIVYSLGSSIMCGLLLWMSLCWYAPMAMKDTMYAMFSNIPDVPGPSPPKEPEDAPPN